MAAVLAGLACGPLAAQPSVDSVPMQAIYGVGVHSFFAGQLGRSYDDLTNAIEAGSRDPRVYYFRGLAALRMGRTDEAEADFTKGAELEADPQRLMAVDVARSLERVQGPDRLQLERHRTRARLVSQQQNRRASQRRFLDTMDAQEEVQRPRPGGDGQIQEQIDQFQESDGAAGNPPAELPPLAEPGMEPEPSPRPQEPAEKGIDEVEERGTDEPVEPMPAKPVDEEPTVEEPAERMPAEPAPEEPVADAPARQPADEPAAGMKDENGADAADGEAPAAAGDGDAADLSAERDAEPPMEDKDALGEGEPFSP
ncbi:MAG: hypothetical protein EBR23_05555 [Planctomycetia bacterium]|nr:hypothetical protein [Planctomycetia bacterium]